MQVIETLAEGLKREIKVVIPAKDMEQQMNERLADAKDKVRINGFRPGKVPVAHLKKMYGKSIMAELVNEIVRDRPSAILSERGEKSATQPSIKMTEDEAEAEKILSAQADLEFTLSYEVIRRSNFSRPRVSRSRAKWSKFRKTKSTNRSRRLLKALAPLKRRTVLLRTAIA